MKAGFGAEAQTLPVVDEQWRHYRSANFELYSRNEDRASREVLQHLELLRAVFLERFKFVERSKLEVTVYYFRTLAEFRDYAPKASGEETSSRGFYQAFPDRAIICLAPVEDWQLKVQRVVFHEYVHHLFRAAEADPPLWYDEGMAELLSSISRTGQMLEIGHPHEERVSILRSETLIPLEQLFAVEHGSPLYRSKDHAGLFYAQAWALVHYWYCGDSGLSTESIVRFLQLAGDRRKASSIDLRAYFRECFGMDYPEMLRRLQKYIERGRYRFSRQTPPRIDPPESYAARAVDSTEARLRMAELQLRVDRRASAKFVLVDAAATGANDSRVFEVLGAIARMEGDEATARHRWEQAEVAGSRNGAVNRELSLIESRMWLAEFDYHFRLPAETAERLRARLRRAIDDEPRQTAAYELLAWVEASAETPLISNVNLVQQQFGVLRQKHRTVLALALVRLRTGRTDEAKRLLASMDQLDWDPWSGQAAEVVRAKLEGRLPQLVSGPPSAKVKQENIVASRFRKYPSVELPEAP